MTDIHVLPDIDAYAEERSGKSMTYAAPGQLILRIHGLPKRPETWHRFILWDRHDDVEAEEFNPRLWAWCETNKVRLPSGKFIAGFGCPLFVATACATKAMLFKLTFGGAA